MAFLQNIFSELPFMNTSAIISSENENICPLSETYTFLRFSIIVVATVISFLGTIANGLLIYIFCTKKQQAGTPATLYPTALAFLDFAICLEYILLFGVDAIVTFAQVKSLFILYYIYIIPVWVVAKITQLAIPYMLILATLERLMWTYGSIRYTCVRTMYSQSGRIWTMVICSIIFVLIRIPAAFSIEVAEYPMCQDFFRSKITGPTVMGQSFWYYVFDFHLMTLTQTVVPFIILVILNMIIVRKMGGQDTKNEETVRPATPSPTLSRILFSGEDSSPKTRKISALGLPLQSLKGMSPGVRSAVYTMTAIVTSYLISNTLHLILTILERSDHPWLVDESDNTLSSPFHTYFADMVSFVYMFTSAIRLFIYYICNPTMRKDINTVLRSEIESEIYL